MNLKNLKGKKHLERAIVLGLVLSTGVCGSAWAEKTINEQINSSNFEKNYSQIFEENVEIVHNNANTSAVLSDGSVTIGLKTAKDENNKQVYNLTINSDGHGIYTTVNSTGNVLMEAKNNYITFGSNNEAHGIAVKSTQKLDTGVNSVRISATEDNVITSNNGAYGDGINVDKESNQAVYLTAGKNNIINVTGQQSDGIYTDNGSKQPVRLWAYTGDNFITAGNNGIDHRGNGNVILNSYQVENIYDEDGKFVKQEINYIGSNKIVTTHGDGIRTAEGTGNVTLEAKTNHISAGDNGIQSDGRGTITVKAVGLDNSIYGKANGIYATNGTVNVTADGYNVVSARTDDNSEFTTLKAINAYKGSTVTLDAGISNILSGAVYATGDTDGNKTAYSTDATLVTIGGGENVENYINSATVIADAGDLTDKTIISALYAEKGALVNLSGAANAISTYADSESEDLERTVWAYDGAHINIDGATTISTNSYDKSHNSNDIAIVAGTAKELTKADFVKLVDAEGKPVTDADANTKIYEVPILNGADFAEVNLYYENYANGAKSSVTGDIVAGYKGSVIIEAADENAGLNITGNLLAGNGGTLVVDLGNGGVLTGRIDDYVDAGIENGHGAGESVKNSFFNPAFSSNIIESGQVNLDMGLDSTWTVTGQSWVSSINTEGGVNDTLIDLTKMEDVYNANSSALTVGSFIGNTTFNMNITGNRSVTDMLYFGYADGEYLINLVNPVGVDEINYDATKGMEFDGLRFATVGSGNVSFKVQYIDGGVNDITYEVGTDKYDGNPENDHYNSTNATGDADQHRPGSDSVDSLMSEAGGIMLLNNILEEDVEIDVQATDYKLIAPRTTLSTVGQTILNMSRANYSNAIYMDRLNKRMGEARYINSEEDEGMWVRIRHDRIGKTDAYRSQNTMYELGYDQKQECDNGERRVGFAVDYMHGDTGYSDIAGKGEIDRYGLWLYDTWTGDKGHYADYVAKWGHLDNEFEIYNSRGKATGDYSNNVFSISAEYGRKKDMGSDWYFEPQAQLQLARVTGADYVTSQGTKVSVEGINSLIGRAGFRLGKDFGTEKQSTVYVKADVLHEFLGDQDIRALDTTTGGNWSKISYENGGTWYDFGFGFATMMSKSSYAFLDLERSFGHDNDETWQINAGVQWSF